jgi:predicted RNase H-like HicB family nuclease
VKVTTYKATATRDGRWWSVELHGLPGSSFGYTQGRDLEDAEAMARDAVATLLDVPIESIAIELTVAGLETTVDEVRAARKAREEAEREAQETLMRAAHELKARGITQRDAARILGISHQRVNQLLHAA